VRCDVRFVTHSTSCLFFSSSSKRQHQREI
jgi:hypothetical protein